MASAKQSLVASEVKKALHAFRGDVRDYDPLLKLIHGARFCLLGASRVCRWRGLGLVENQFHRFASSRHFNNLILAVPY